MSNKFSVIIPAYNCEKTIRLCVDSVLAQNYENFEIIIINDGSTDGTSKKLEKYKSNKNVKIINQKNCGVSIARNNGLLNATGDWIVFLDSDDWIEETSLVRLNALINKYDPDYIITPLIYNGKINDNVEDIIIMDKTDIFDNVVCLEYSNQKLNGRYKNCRCAGGKVIKKELITDNNIQFPPKIKKFEDGIFNLYVTYYAKNILYTTYQFYNYFYNNPTSRMNTINEDEVLEDIKVFEIISSFLKNKNIDIESLEYLAFYMYILGVDSIMHQVYDRKMRKQYIKDLKKKYSFKNIKMRYLKFNKKIEYIFDKFGLIEFLYLLKVKVFRR